MVDPYLTSFTDKPKNGNRNITRQELITYEWRGSNLCKITTVRKFYKDGDYQDDQTVEVIYIE